MLADEFEPDDQDDPTAVWKGVIAAFLLWIIVMVLIGGVMKSCGIG